MAVSTAFFVMLNIILYLQILLTNPDPGFVYKQTYIRGYIQSQELGSKSFSLQKRHDDLWVNEIFKDNILLNLHYLAGSVTKKEEINWENIQKPFNYEFTLEPGQGFAYHDQILTEYKGKIVKTTNSHFNFQDGYKSSGFLYGDGICHLASLIHWAAVEAGLYSFSPVSHDFAKINEVPGEYGVSIKYMPANFGNSALQNLYIVNNQEKPVTFVFDYDGENVSVKVLQSR